MNQIVDEALSNTYLRFDKDDVALTLEEDISTQKKDPSWSTITYKLAANEVGISYVQAYKWGYHQKINRKIVCDKKRKIRRIDLIQGCNDESSMKNYKECYGLCTNNPYFPYSNLLNMNDMLDLNKTVTTLVDSIPTKNKKSSLDIWLEN